MNEKIEQLNRNFFASFHQIGAGDFAQLQLSKLFLDGLGQRVINWDQEVSTSNGRIDFVIKIPNSKDLIIESKLNLDLFRNYQDDKKQYSSQITARFKEYRNQILNYLKEPNYENWAIL